MRVVFAECSVDYSGRLDAYLPRAPRLIMIKADGSVLVHSDGGSYKPLNWMSAPCTFTESEVLAEEAEAGVTAVWLVANAKTNDALSIKIYEILGEMEQQLGQDPPSASARRRQPRTPRARSSRPPVSRRAMRRSTPRLYR